MKTIISSPLAPQAVGPYSQAVEANGTLYISGQLPLNRANGGVPEGIEAQTKQSLENLTSILVEAGYSLSNVVKTTVLLDSIEDFAAMNGVYATFFTEDMPARVCFEVAKLPLGVLVEIDAIACK